MNSNEKAEARTELVVARQNVMAQQRQTEDDEIDLVELVGVLLDKLHYIVFFFLLGAVLLNAYAYGFIRPTYESTASIYIVSASGGTVVDLTDLNIGSSLKNDYRELILSYPVLDQVSRKLSLDWSTDQMERAIRVDNPADTRILNLTATAHSPELAMDIANMLARVAVEYLPETMSTEAPNIAQKGRLPKKKANPSYAKYTAMGGLLGLLLSCGWIIVRHLMDDTIRTPEDMEKYFSAAPLAAIPYTDVFQFSDHHEAPNYNGARSILQRLARTGRHSGKRKGKRK